MSVLDKISNWFKSEESPAAESITPVVEIPVEERSIRAAYDPVYNHVMSVSYNGEKNLGGIGRILNYVVDYEGLRARSWHAYLDSERAQTSIERLLAWVIGPGLKLRSERKKKLLELEGITWDTDEFSKTID